MKQMEGMFWEPEFYAVYEFRTAVSRPDWDGRALVDQVFKRKMKLFCLPDVDELLRYQLLTVSYMFEGTTTPAFIRRIAYVFDEVVVVVNSNGQLQKVENIERIKARWVVTKAELEINHKGAAIGAYFNSIDQLLEDEQTLVNFLSEAKMFGMLFCGLGNQKEQVLFEEFTVGDEQIKDRHKIISIKNELNDVAGQFIFTKHYLEEGYLKNGNTQCEILWLGKQKIQ